MYVSRLKLKNWKNFRDVDVILGPRAFVIGPNASGKSNFLDALRFLRDIVKPGGGLQKAVSDRGGISKIRCLAARTESQIEMEVELTEFGDSKPQWKYAIGIKQEPRGNRQPRLLYERVWKETEKILARPDLFDQKDDLRLIQTHLEQINSNKDFRDIAKFFESVLYLHLIPQVLRYPENFAGKTINEDPFGKDLLERVARSPDRIRKSRLKKIEAALRIAVPQLKQFTDTKDERGVPHLEAVYEHWRPNAGKQREDQFSDGTLRLIGLLWSLLDGESLLLLEEPELSLHAAIVRKLPGLLYRLQSQKQRQIILSTHSADLLSDSGIAPEEVLLLTPSVEGTSVDLASSLKQLKNLLEGGLNMGEAALPLTEPQNVYQLDMFNG